MFRTLIAEKAQSTRRRLVSGSETEVGDKNLRSMEENDDDDEINSLTAESKTDVNATDGGTDEEEEFAVEDTDYDPSTEEADNGDGGTVTSSTLEEQDANHDDANGDGEEENEEDFLATEEEIEETLEEWEEATEEHDAEWFAEFDATHNFTAYGFVDYGDDENEDGEGDNNGGETVEQIEEELEKEELEAELEYEAEDAKLDAEGYIDGTEPIINGDEFEPTIMPMDDTNSTTVDDEIEEELEAWEQDAIEEWKQAEEEQDEPTDDTTSTPVDEEEEAWEEDALEPSANDDDQTGNQGDMTNDDEQVDNQGEMANDDEEPTDDDDQKEPDQVPVKEDDEPGWTGETEDDTVQVGTDDDNLVPSPSPVNSPTGIPPVASPTLSPDELPKIADCIGVVGQLQCGYEQYSFVVYALVAFVPFFLICCLRKYCCRSKSGDTHGEYRAVAAQYGDMGYDNTFSDTFSDDEDDDFLDGNGDIEDDSWGKSGKRTLELAHLGRERNGGLSLAEMNG